MNEKSHKLIEYSVLIFGVVIFALFFLFYKGGFSGRLLITASAGVFYTLWGVIHHWLEKRLTLEIALEYILISFFTFLLVLISLSV